MHDDPNAMPQSVLKVSDVIQFYQMGSDSDRSSILYRRGPKGWYKIKLSLFIAVENRTQSQLAPINRIFSTKKLCWQNI